MILLLDVPGLNIGYLGFYGNTWTSTPNLDRLAGEGIVFDRHYAAGPNSLKTGRYHFPTGGTVADVGPHKLGDYFHAIDAADSSAPFDEQMPRVLRATMKAVKKPKAGEQSLVWAQLPSLAPPWSFSEGVLEECFEEGSEPDLWLDPPEMLTPDRGGLERLQDTYAAVLAFLDNQLGGFFDELSESELLNRLLIVLTSSSGLSLGEHGWIGHPRAWQHEEQVHLPLVVRLPDANQAGLRMGALTQPLDILPTFLEFNNSRPGEFDGQSLWPLIRQEKSAIRLQAPSADQVGDSVEWSLRTHDWAFLLPIAVPAGDESRGPQLYIKPADRWEVDNVAQPHPEQMETMEKTLRELAGL